MDLNVKQEKLKQKINTHLRSITRQLIKFDTLEETLNYLLESFYKEFTCDLVGVILKEDNKLIPRVWIGEEFTIEKTLRLDVEDCSANLLEDALWGPNDQQETFPCSFRKAMEKEEILTWFTVPLNHNKKQIGLCVIGFRDFIPLVIEAEKIFVEFGHDVAVAIDLAKEKEKQKRKIKGIEWIRENIYPGSTIEDLIEKIVERAGKGTQAKGAMVYLFDEPNSCFSFHPPFYGSVTLSENISVDTNFPIDNYFPAVEIPGCNELTVPLSVNLKTIGVLYVCKNENEQFSDDDLEFLKFVSAFVSMQIENARLYELEFESKKRMERLMEHHQELVKKTVQGEDLNDISKTISSMLESSILLYDRFLKPMSSYFKYEDKNLQSIIEKKVIEQKQRITQLNSREFWLNRYEDRGVPCAVWPITGGRDTLGYLVISLPNRTIDRVLRLTLDYALNVYAIEFIKQKSVLDAKEQVKESFINQLFSKKIDDKEKLIQYATLINWDVLEPHQIATMSLEINGQEETNVVVLESYRTWLWDQIKTSLSLYDSSIILTRKDNEFILIVKTIGDKGKLDYWQKLHQRMLTLVTKERMKTTIYLGIGGKTAKLEDYYYCYVQSVKTKNVVSHRYLQGGFSFYDDLGSYTILNNTSDQLAAELFVKKHLGPLLKYSMNNSVNLFETLQVYLNNNGSLSNASKQLFIHRSTLEYRLERVLELIQIDLDDAEMRFELMMAYKLYSLFNFNSNQLI
ncbi:helix-turn-helix domain-containing protein [Salipaludibacillus sp. CF4.18]|uniref:helix-turn-helix domain-containing protein n=1 Tax=Salipaludibacillus sp. CF4.18 TaxID=3373081 RepID=UPI003EE5C574